MNTRALSIAFVLAAIPACSGPATSGPPALRVGRDECAECGMLIAEDRCSAGLITDHRGRREAFLFDDIACMLDFEGRGGHAVLQRYLHDHPTREWIPDTHATLLLADPDRLATPMGSGIVAFRSPDDAAHAQASHGGRILNYTAAAEARRAWKLERYGPPK